MKNILPLLFIGILVSSSCKKDSRADIQVENAPYVPVELPVACDLISENEMLEALGINEDLEVLDGNRNVSSMNSVSCFYKWNDQNLGSVGVMIQVQRNPLPDEINNFVTTYFNNKKFEGEASYDDPNNSFKYVDFPKETEWPTIYNDQLNRYYFAQDQNLMYSVAFNYPKTRDEIDGYFLKIANMMIAKI